MYRNMIGELQNKYPTISFTDTAGFFCDDSYCYGAGAGGLWYATRDHLTTAGSREFVKSFIKLIDQQSQSSNSR